MQSLLCPLHKIILLIGKNSEKRIMQLVRESGYAPQTVRKIVDSLKARGYVVERKEGKYSYVELTDDGKILYECVYVLQILDRGDKVEKLSIRVGTA